MSFLLQDLRHAFRMHVRNPAFSAVAVITLALGIGANVAIFCVVDAVLIRPLPFADPDRIAAIKWEEKASGATQSNLSAAEILDYRKRSRAFTSLAAYFYDSFSLTSAEHPALVWGDHISPEMLTVLGVQPAIGRSFLPEEEEPGHGHVVILSHYLWKNHFGGDVSVVGRSIRLSDESYVVVGIMPPSFYSINGNDEWPDEVLVPLVFDPPMLKNRRSFGIKVLGRLRTGIEPGRAEAKLIYEQFRKQYPDAYRSELGLSFRLVTLRENLIENARPAILMLWVAVAFVLLIACANVANLLLSRATKREGEMAIRMSLGARPSRLWCQLVTESLVLSLIGCSGGLFLGYWSVSALERLNRFSVPLLSNSSIDLNVLGFAIGISLLSSLIFSSATALQLFNGSLSDRMAGSGRAKMGTAAKSRLQNVFIVSQLAIALTLLAGAGLAMKSFLRLLRTDFGFSASNVMSAWISLPDSRYPSKPMQARFYEQLLARLHGSPGLRQASLVSFPPFGWRGPDSCFSVDGTLTSREQGCPVALIRLVSPSYFETMSIRLLYGRDFSMQDNSQAAPVLIISQSLARRYPSEKDSIGREMDVAGGAQAGVPRIRGRVVGVVADTRYSPSIDPAPMIYVAYFQYPTSAENLMVRTEGDPLAALPELQRNVWAIDKDQPVYLPKTMETMQERVSNTLAYPRLVTCLLGLFATIAVLLACVGVYGVISYWIAARSQEIGIRIALGARSADVLRLIVGRSLIQSLLGVAIGLIGALALTRYVSSVMYGVRPDDPVILGAVSIGLTVVAMLASYIPAKRATKIDPNVVLRSE